MNKKYDSVIIGGGPAGATLARLLAPARKVLLIERRDFSRPWRNGQAAKCCGGLLAPDAQRSLARLGLALPREVLGGPQLFAVRALDLSSRLERFYQRFYLNLNREAFDRWLAHLAQDAGCDVCWGGQFITYAAGVVTYRHEGRLHEVACGQLVGADGAGSTVRRRSRPEKGESKSDLYIAIQEEYEADRHIPFFSAYFEPELTDFYMWSIPKCDSVLLGGAFKNDGSAAQKFAILKDKLEKNGMTFGKRIDRQGSLLRRPRSLSGFWLGEGDVFTVGEAAGLVSPSSAEGFSYAFESARILGELLLEREEPTVAEYKRRSFKLLAGLYLKNLKTPFIYNPVIRKAIMQSGFGGIGMKGGG